MWWFRIAEAISKCKLCNYVDKPFIKFKVYQKYAPASVKVLIISESPPPGYKEDFLYNLDHRDRLRRVLCRYLSFENGDKLLEFFKSRGIFWSVAVKCRPRDRKNLSKMYRNCRKIALLEVRLAKPEKLILLGSVALKQYRSIKSELNYRSEIIVERHPLYVVRFQRYRMEDYFSRLERLIKGFVD